MSPSAGAGARPTEDQDGLATVEVGVEPPYEVVIGGGALDAARRRTVDELAAGRRIAVLTDRRVEALYRSRFDPSGTVACLAVDPGEESKDFAHLEQVLEFLAASALDRLSLLVTLGGGVVGDLGGLAAALYMRGIDVVHCPTTLLAQVDASVGGKTAVNLSAGKNLAGSFHQPRAVYADTNTLATLDEVDLHSGLGEVVKTAWIAGAAHLAAIERDAEALAARDAPALARAVEACVRTKAGIVAGDPREAGARAILNLGHTFAHGIEHACGYGAVPHGVAVAVGLVLALRCAAEMDLLDDPADVPRARRLLRRLGLPCDLHDLEPSPSPEAVRSAMALDKKGRAGRIRLVLPRAPGAIEHGVEAPAELLARVLTSREPSD